MTVIIKADRWKTAPNYNVALAPEFIRPSFSGLITPFNGKTTYQSGAVLKASSGGLGLGASSGNGWQAGTSRVLAGEDKSTLIIAVGTNYGTSSYIGKAYCERSEGTQIFKFGFAGESAPRAHFVWRNASSQLISLVGDSVPDAELRPVSIMAAVVNGSASRTVYLNGIKNTDTTNYANTFTAANDVRICGDAQDAAETFSHNVFWVLRYKEALPFAFLDELVNSPFSIFRREKSRIYFFPSAGGGGATITPTGLSSSAFGSFSVNAGDRILTFTGKASDEAFGTFNLRARNKILLTGKSSNEAFGSFNVYPGKVILLPNSKTSDNAIGSSSLLSGQKLINPVAKTTDNAFGSFIIISGDRILLINGIASSEAFGPFSVNNNTATQNVLPSGYFDSAFGSFSLRPDQYIIFEGKEYLEFGQFLLSGSAVVRAMHFFDWVSQQPGLRGSMNDKLYQYLIAQGFTGSTPTMLFLWLRSLGYAGNTATMLTAFERDYTTRWH